MRVSYEQQMRDKAATEQKGLVTIQVVAPGKQPGKFGQKITAQRPVSEQDYEKATRFLLRFMLPSGGGRKGKKS